MALGPQVCLTCEMIYIYSDAAPHWRCQECGETDSPTHLFEISTERRGRFKMVPLHNEIHHHDEDSASAAIQSIRNGAPK